ncbi:hypothetical protein [Streptomyces sp. NPDC048192]
MTGTEWRSRLPASDVAALRELLAYAVWDVGSGLAELRHAGR